MSEPALKPQEETDADNRAYWNTLCGTQLAKTLGITDFSRESLKRFDDYYLDFYDYLTTHVPLGKLRGKKVLEIGLGYGTLAQQIAGVADYTGLDIAAGPVGVVNDRLAMLGLPGRAQQGSILEPPFAPESFDAIVSIGCLHHTGNLPRAVAEVRRLLKPGGTVHLMLYNAYSYRRWASYGKETLAHFMKDYFTRRPAANAGVAERDAYDFEAPETVFTSARQARHLLQGFENITITRENAQPESVFIKWTREGMRRWISPNWGLDLYITATKCGS